MASDEKKGRAARERSDATSFNQDRNAPGRHGEARSYAGPIVGAVVVLAVVAMLAFGLMDRTPSDSVTPNPQTTTQPTTNTAPGTAPTTAPAPATPK